ncbi:SNF2-related protein [Lactococcus petauri]|uniref:SNF2-related protein n=1 Tax=Lactococcus petauri TaxID=1940789 RepID=UPI003855568D
MDLKETTKRVQEYIETLKYKSFANKLDFLRFNSYHHHRPMSEVLQIFVQNPEARLLGSFDFWKDFSEESSVEFGQKSSVRIFDKQGKTKEVLYDLAQTTLKGDADLSLIPFREPVLSSELLFNTLVSLSGGSLTLDDYTSDKYFEESLAEIERFFEPYRESLTKFTKEEVDAALEVVRYNLYEEFGVYLSEEFDYSSIENSVTNTLQHFSHDRFLPVFSLANNISKELTNQVKEKYQVVELQLNEIKQDQLKFNEQMEELDVEVDFSAKQKVEKVKENTIGSSGILDKLEKAASDQGFYLWTRNENWTDDPEDDEGIQFLFDEGLYEANAYDFKTVEELDEWLDNEEVFIVDGLGNHTTFVELNQFVQQEEQKILGFENNMSDAIYDFVARDSDLFEQVMHEPFGDIAVDVGSNRDKITSYRVDTETKELYTWFEMEKSTGIVLSQDKSFANISEPQKRELLSHLKREYDAKFVMTKNISESTPKIETHMQDGKTNFPYKVGDILSHHWIDDSKKAHHQIFRIARLADEKTGQILLDEVESKNGQPYKKSGQVGNGVLAVSGYEIASDKERAIFEEVFDGKVPAISTEDIDKNTPAVIQVNWNEGSDNDNFKFLNQNHDDEDISLEMLKAMIYDEVQLENNPETGYYKVSTTFDRIDIGEGFESNKELYQDIARSNNLEIDVHTYYDSIALEKDKVLSTQEILQLARDKMSLPEDIKVKPSGGGSFSLMKEQFGGVLNQSVVDWYPGGKLEVKDAAEHLTGVPLFEQQFYEVLAEIITEEISEIQKEEHKVTEKAEPDTPKTEEVSLLDQFPNAEERDELDPMEDFIGMLMSGEDELTIIVDDKDVYHHKISDSKDGQQIIFEMRQDKSSDTRYLVYENGKFIKNTFGDDIPDSRLINPIGLDDLEQRLEENKLKLQNQAEVSQQAQEISLFDSFDADKEKNAVVPTQKRLSFEFPLESRAISEFYPGTPGEKVKANIAAIRVAKKLSDENRLATVDEQQVLSRYVGWGGLANNFFDESNPRYSELREELKTLVTEHEYSNMLQSSLTAYYTSPEVIQTMYKHLNHLGFKGGRVLDPSMGTGNFFASMPGSLKNNSDLYGVELDAITGQIATNLQQTSQVQIKGFQDTNFNDNALDLVTTNVPFGQIMIGDEKYSRNYAIHDYFIKKSLDLVHEGGVVAVITSTATMDKTDSRFREEIAKQANLVSAVRLPNDAFKNIAGTDVSSDILIFQKTSTSERKPDWINTHNLNDDLGNRVSINRYFHEHPEFVLGQVGIKTFNGGVLTVKRDFEEEQYIPKLAEALDNQSDAAYYSHNKSEELIESFGAEEYSLPSEVLEAQEPFTLFVYNSKPYFYDGKHVVPHYKQSSVTLNKGETRKRQLERFEKVQDRIFDTKVKYKTVYSQIGYFDTWSNFIPTGVGSAFNLQDIPSDVLEKLNKETDSVTRGDYRYTIIPEKEQLSLKIEEVVNRQYLYHVDYSKKEINAIEKMIDLRHSLQDLLNIQHKPGYTKEEYEQLRISFNEKYDDFVEQYGYISDSSNRQIMREDDYYPFLASVEEEAEDVITKEPILTKSAVFFEPTIQPEQKVVKVETAHDALLASLNRKGHLDFEYMADIYGKTEDEMIEELGDSIYYIGDGEYVTREDFLSGDVKTKLVEAENNQEFNHEDRDWTTNIKALQEVIPEDLLLSDITFKFGARFIPLPVYEKFLSEIMNTKAKVIYDKPSDSYKVMVADTYKLAVTDTYGYKGYNGEKLATALLNQREAKIYKPDADNPTKRVLDEHGTSIMEDKANLLKDNFRTWVLTNPEASEQIVEVYNDKFNRYVTKGYDGQSFTVKGLAKQYTLRPHQKNAAMRIVQDERAGLAHEVGSGKTLTMLASCMKLQELGVVNKPLFVIPKPLIMQFAKEIYKYFPESKVLVARTEDFKKENRKRFISRIANGSYNAIVIADSQFEKVSMSKEYQANYLRNQLFEAREQLGKMDQDNKYTVKRTEKAIEGLEARLLKLQKQDTDTFINFEDLGIDMLYVDEAHGYKNLAPFSQLENVKGISTTRSQKAMDMQQKVEYLQSIYNNKRVVFSTGTPMSNSVVELYTMTKFIAPDVLEQFGISSFDTWVSSFGIIENNFELTAAGAYKINRRFTKFGNVPELMNTFRSTWDIQTQDMLDLPVPEVEIISHESEVTEAQDKFIDSLLARAEAIEDGAVKPYEDNMLKIVGESKKAALDMRTLDDVTFTDSDSDKISQVVASVTKIYFDTQEEKSTQAIFCDQSIPVKYRNGTSKNPDHTINNFSAYDEIKRQLVANGIPAEEISFVHDTTDKTKDALMKDMRTGKRRILLGSTSKAGTGLNIQDKLIAVHHVDLPWRPSDLTQRNGRIIRQGNENDKVQVHYYITKGSMDAYLWQTLENKAKVINQIMLGDTKIREMDELSNDQINMAKFKAIAEADPVRQEYMETEMKLQSLERSRERFFDSQISNVKRVKREKERLPKFEERLELITADLKEVEATENKSFSIAVHYKGNDRVFTEDDKKTEVAEFLAKQINNNTLAYNFAKATGANDKKITHIATYRNFQILHNPVLEDGEKERLILKGEAQYSFWVNPSAPLGILTRLDGLFEKGISRDYLNTSEEISQIKSSINYIESNKDSTFPKEKEYQEVKSRCAELRDALENKKRTHKK